MQVKICPTIHHLPFLLHHHLLHGIASLSKQDHLLQETDPFLDMNYTTLPLVRDGDGDNYFILL